MARSSRWIVAIGMLACLATTGCTSSSIEEPPSEPPGSLASDQPSPETPSSALIDPLDRITDPSSDDFVDSNVQAVLNESGYGPATFEIQRPESTATELRFYVVCTEGEFTVTLGTFYSGQCVPDFTSSGSIPLPQDNGLMKVELDVSKDAGYRIVAIPVQ